MPPGGHVVAAMPDFGHGLCTREELDIFRRAQSDDRTGATASAREQAKGICLDRCPLLVECQDYVLGQERPVGSWAGVWGGLDADDRKRIHRAEH